MSKTYDHELMDVDEYKRDIPEGRLRAEGRVDFQFDPTGLPMPVGQTKQTGETHRVKLYNMLNLPQKIQNWVLLLFMILNLVSTLISTAASLGWISQPPYNNKNSTCTCPTLLKTR